MYRHAVWITVVAAAMGCAQSPSTTVETTTAANNDYSARGEADPEEKVCERVRRTGSHRSTVICRTRAEIEQEAAAGKDTFDQLYDSQRASGEY